MYLDYWGLHSAPFSNTPDRNVFFQSPQHKEAVYRLMYVIEHRKGAAMITGEVGCGKTTLLAALSNFFVDDRYDLLFIYNPAVDPTDLIRAVLFQVGDDCESHSKAVLLDRLRRRLEKQVAQGVETVLVIDEAHMISNRRTFEEIRMLLNMQINGKGLLTIILSGQPRLPRQIASLRPLSERIAMRIELPPLDAKNTAYYIYYRLKRAGLGRGIFSKQALLEVFKSSRGIPLRINNICDRCLLLGLMRKSKEITAQIARDAASETI